MKKTAVEWLGFELNMLLMDVTEEQWYKAEKLFQLAKEMEKEQIINAGNICALEHHLHSYKINKMSAEELEQYKLEPTYTFGEEYYNETFKQDETDSN